MNDRDRLQRILVTRADGDVAAMTDAELLAYRADLARELNAISRPCTAYDAKDPEAVRRAATGAELFRRLVLAGQEAERRKPRIIA